MIKHSTSHELLGTLDCPVLVVRSSSSAATHDAQRMLLAVAGPEDTPNAVEAAIAAAAAPGSAVMVAHVRQSYIGTQGFAFLEPEEDIQSTVAKAVRALNEAGIEAQSVIAQAGPVAQTVAELAASWNADVIVLGSSRMGDFESLLLGSVTNQLLRTSNTPVLVAERRR
jgi:nucleotide-binding universal stress UspA family protein